MKGILTALLLSLLPLVAQAGPLDERAALAHLQAVAAGDVEVLMASYGEDPYMDWIGGPLDGRYRGTEAIREVWAKWLKLNDGQPRQMVRSAIEPYAHPKGVTIEASAQYAGKTSVKVWHVLSYRDGKLLTEIWQIAPALEITPEH